jgi:DNA polymerase V
MRGIAEAPIGLLEKQFGILVEEMRNHAFGKEDVSLSMVKEYKPINKSISKSEILFTDYSKEEAWIQLLEMTYLSTIQMCMNNIDAKGLSFYVGYNHNRELGGVPKSVSCEYRLRDFISIQKILKELYLKYFYEGQRRSVGISLCGIEAIGIRQLSLFHM